MRLTSFVLFSVVLFLGGCVTSKPYVSTSSSKPRAKVTIIKDRDFSDLDVYIFEPDQSCKMQHMGTVSLEKEHMSEVIYVPAGRQYFRVHGFFHLPLTGASTGFHEKSFIAEPGGEYQIILEYGGVGGYRKTAYKMYTLDVSAGGSRVVQTSGFSVCKE
ncbi:MAG: hypothetical protein KC684_01430 [Candidatus Omnitrophica bacterium]|nr:hypothetical protein [Candidatus Omnitrophota bacterium]